ncbi:DUF5004 domain-containing protein [Sphingobacterium hungaricum]|uniref:DUF5004 domain-containing protein n=1 Tax=Sphingobacterium hungaricum TaxID=2082723 RepID=A0A928YRU6_9SPHI|nr:DUF5004 domain-containing protein [Sphingobacterium hungaricum]MBE8715334.1 DUF5004 domain-containing protein [Sphingobacterium hungaricum]
MKNSAIRGFMMLILIAQLSCKDEISKMVFDETNKDITGNWKVVQLTRNGEEIGKRMDLSGFYINFKNDGTYDLSEELPFVLNEEGNYTLSDPQYPFGIILHPKGQTNTVPVKFQFPIVKGERQLSLSFSLGCSTNTYQYQFERQN